jgi:xylose isomerase
MRTYRILAAKARAFDADPEVRAILAANAHADEPLGCASILRTGGASAAAHLSPLAIDPEAIAARGLRYERLDQLLMEHLMGVRGGAHA